MLKSKISIVVAVVALGMCAYHMVFTRVVIQGVSGHLNTHLGFCLLLVFLTTLGQGKRKIWRIVAAAAVLLSLIATVYVQIFSHTLEMRGWFSTPIDLIIGAILILLVLEATRENFGLLMPLLTIGVVLYPLIGQYLPGPFHCLSLPIPETISNLSVAMAGGIYGKALVTSANYIFLFIVFGGVLQAVGATEFFMQLGRLLSGKIRGGPGLMSVVSSAATGSVTGSTAANIAITGSFTIPLMKRVGYKPEQAAAIEAAASNGGQIMPPVMGIVAFGMAGMTGIPYLKIVLMAIVPAILYFFSTGVYVYLRAAKLHLAKSEEKLDKRELLLSSPLFLVPILVIIITLVMGYTIMTVAFFAIITVVVVSMIRKKTRPPLARVLSGFINGAKLGAGIGAMCAAIGMILTTLTMSGIGVKLSSGIDAWSGGNLPLALLIVATICILMGMGGTSLTGYIIVAIFAAPALMKIGIPLEQAHFFVMFVAVFAFVTPPVAIGALIAARMASANYMKTAIEATKVAIGGFLLPYMFIYVPILLLQPQKPILAAIGLIACVGTLLALQIGFVGYYRTDCGWLERILALVSAALLFTYIFLQNYIVFLAGIAIFVLLTLWQWRKGESASHI